MNEKKYITQLTAEDLRELFAAANPVAGFCIRIEKTDGALKIGIDENALRLAINGFVRNGGTLTDAAGCVNVSMNPQT